MRRRGLWKLAAAAAVVLGALLVVASLSPATTAGVCSVAAGPVMLRDVPEASGLAVSGRDHEILWTHNDSGNDSVLYAIDTGGGGVHGPVRVPVRFRDWEDISAAPCGPSISADGKRESCLYLADIGDNELGRRALQIVRVPEPAPNAARTAQPMIFTASYPDGVHNAEAAFIAGGRLFIVTKDRKGLLYRSATAIDDTASPRTMVLQRVGELELTGVTDAETTLDGMSVAVRTTHEVAIYRTADLIDAPDPSTSSGSPRAQPRGDKARPRVPAMRIPIDGLREPQGEGVALGENGMIYLASEGRPWNRAGRFVSLQCPSRPL